MTNGLVEAVCLSSGGDDERSSAWAVGCSYGHQGMPTKIYENENNEFLTRELFNTRVNILNKYVS